MKKLVSPSDISLSTILFLLLINIYESMNTNATPEINTKMDNFWLTSSMAYNFNVCWIIANIGQENSQILGRFFSHIKILILLILKNAPL